MKPKNVKEKIKRCREALKFNKVVIKTYERDRDADNYKERVAKQKKIIFEAEQAIARIRHQRKKATQKISKVKQHSRYVTKQLVELLNCDKIELLLKLAERLRKETDDGKTDSN